MSECKRISLKNRLRENWRKNPYMCLGFLSLMVFSVIDFVERHTDPPFKTALFVVEWLAVILMIVFFWKFIVRISRPH